MYGEAFIAFRPNPPIYGRRRQLMRRGLFPLPVIAFSPNGRKKYSFGFISSGETRDCHRNQDNCYDFIASFGVTPDRCPAWMLLLLAQSSKVWSQMNATHE
ncbi:hypothetical protein NPIL_522221 [Nephila pilipes]|uniref:Uncharacterized protein n=1 Tax=Nephila pilipes TaxID=299642 RepID=A0A8X6UN65_NEPPI|nr:hypothetical protein NPIL_522221 [Nephila pilipes]